MMKTKKLVWLLLVMVLAGIFLGCAAQYGDDEYEQTSVNNTQKPGR
ncbi:MAG: hypothetical protein LBD44_03330 [Spirochaetaceae bacterium]|jgi:hypothetical protein|nr:hypothetical protein [Spirochaetaceae bacterium]